jgi:hypothetical protein
VTTHAHPKLLGVLLGKVLHYHMNADMASTVRMAVLDAICIIEILDEHNMYIKQKNSGFQCNNGMGLFAYRQDVLVVCSKNNNNPIGAVLQTKQSFPKNGGRDELASLETRYINVTSSVFISQAPSGLWNEKAFCCRYEL